MKYDDADWLARVRWAGPSGVSLFCALALTACSSAESGAPSPSSDPGSGKPGADSAAQAPNASSATAELTTPTPVASLMLDDHVIEFYDFERGVLISETGVAGKPALLAGRQQDIRADELVATWTRLAPQVPVPQALIDLQDRLMNLPAQPQTRKLPGAQQRTITTVNPELTITPATDGVATSVQAVREGCNNGCCDRDWLTTNLGWCRDLNYPWQWFFFNDPDSTMMDTTDDAIIYKGAACAAIGTSQYIVQIGGRGGIWPVPEATYRWFNWNAGRNFFLGWDEQAVHSSVNSASNPHPHSYCGQIVWD